MSQPTPTIQLMRLTPLQLTISPTKASATTFTSPCALSPPVTQEMASNIRVPSVQTLAASFHDKSNKVPERYIVSEVEADPVHTDDINLNLPVVDSKRLLDPEFCEEECLKLKHACEDWGFFLLINHGVSKELIDKTKADVAGFFGLPLDRKEAYAIGPDGPEGYGQHFVTSEEQKLEWADLLYLVTQPAASRNMAFWPTDPPTFRDTLDKYSRAIKEEANHLLGLIGKNLGLDPGVIPEKFRNQTQRVRMSYYPPCPEADKVIGLTPHADACGLTLLLQANEVDGLQIRKNGKWFLVKSIPYALIVNIGTALEIMSNGKYRSIMHRVVINTEKERLSIGTFHSPPTVGPLPELTEGGEEKAKYKTMDIESYMKTFFAAKFGGRSCLERMKLE